MDKSEFKGQLHQDYKHAVQFNSNKDVSKEERHEVEYECLTREFGDYNDPNVFWPRHLDTWWPEDHTLVIFWSEDDEERLITPKIVYNGGPETAHMSVDWQIHEVGDMVYFEAAAPGVGHQTFLVTRKDDTGLWGICNEDTIWVPDGDYYQ